MGSKFGFDRKLAAYPAIKLATMQKLAAATRDHFLENFDNQSFDNDPWAELAIRSEPPPKLIVTGELQRRTEDSIKKVTENRIEMENTATDDRGRQYSNYHNEGTERMPRRSIMKQDDKLTMLQLRILEEGTGRIWNAE